MKMNCEYCQKTTEGNLFIKTIYNNVSYLKCNNCALISADLSMNPDSMYHNYSEYDKRLNGLENPSENISKTGEYLIQKVETILTGQTHITDDSRFNILDIGCGPGSLVNKLKKRYVNAGIYGITPSKVECDAAKRFYDVDLINGYFGSTALPDVKFDVVTMFGNVMLHENPVHSFKTIKNILSDGGVLIFDTKNPYSSARMFTKSLSKLNFLSKSGFMKKIQKAAFHGMRFGISRNFIEKIFKELKFEILDISTYGPRSLDISGSSSYDRGILKKVLKIFDKIDYLRNEQAWVRVVCKKK